MPSEKKKKLCKVPSSAGGIFLRFGTCCHLSVPMLCLLLSSKVQNKIAMFHQLPVHWHSLGCKFRTCWRARLNTSPYPSSAGTSKYGGSISCKLCGSRICYAVCWLHFPSKRLQFLWWNIQGAGHFLPWNASVYIDQGLHTCNHLFVALFAIFSLCPFWRKYLISQTENVSPFGKQLLLKEQLTGLQLAAQRECRSRIVPWCRAESQKRRESCFMSFLSRQFLLHGSQEMLWKKHQCSFSCEFLNTNTSEDLALFDDVICSFVP